MLVSTTSTLEGYRIVRYLGVVGGEERVTSWSSAPRALRDSTHRAFAQMRQLAAQTGANAIVGVKIDHGVLGSGSLVMVYGTAVVCVDATTNAPLIDDALDHNDAAATTPPPPPPSDPVL
jgi:uncharacterized protein YbjQ (UPF0145 family)